MQSESSISSISPTARVARWSAAHKWVVLAATLLVLVASVFASGAYEVRLQEGDVGMGDSGEANLILDESFPRGGENVTDQLLFSNPTLTVDDAAYRTMVETLMEHHNNRSIGSSTVNVDPWPGLESGIISPPWSSTIRRQIERPMPVPSSFVV